MKTTIFVVIALLMVIHSNAQKEGSEYAKIDTLPKQPGFAAYFELGGKGLCSINADFPLKSNQRLCFGLSVMDYSTADYEYYHIGSGGAFTPGLMYYYLKGKRNSYLELGLGASLFYRLDVDYAENDSPFTLHGVIGYRYQKKNGLIFRAGFTPWYRVNWSFLPLVGVSLGYSW